MTDEQFGVHDKTGVLDHQRDAAGVVMNRVVQIDHDLFGARIDGIGGHRTAAGRTSAQVLRIGSLEQLLVI